MKSLNAPRTRALAARVGATLETLKTRQPLGQPIGRLQARQQRTIAMLMHLEQVRSMTGLAALRFDHPGAATPRQAPAAETIVVGQAFRLAREQAPQQQGGVGITDGPLHSPGCRRRLAIGRGGGGTDARPGRFIAAGHRGTP